MAVLKTGMDSKARVIAALNAGGYTENAFVTCVFEGVNDTGKEVHAITFRDLEGEMGEGNVYVWFDEAKGKLVADF